MLNCKTYSRYDKLKKGGRTILQISTTSKICGNPSWTASPLLSCKDTVLKKTASASKEIWINTHASSAVHTAAIPRCVLHNGKRMQTDADGEKTEKAKPAGYTGNVHARIHPPSKNIYRDARTEAGIAANVHTQDSDVQKVKKYIQTPEKPTIIHYAFQVPSKVASYHQISHTSRPKLLSILCLEHHARRPDRFWTGPPFSERLRFATQIQFRFFSCQKTADIVFMHYNNQQCRKQRKSRNKYPRIRLMQQKIYAI